ncbi:gamma-glutamyltransferase [Catellatospora coxensis]|uniref:Glutathione hydrolase proenzyme n=1 Tax=Catellatospora coxensis TaxID=310354 RepID=A0A8J3PC91_9ACTN|nr:gamma-glutamyltransferase [Catellatospora coxensis]GIG09701.1 gamma-glutamyltranspeptidase [Catellatospora coxensis]
MRLRHRRALAGIAVATLASTAAAGPVQASPRPPDLDKVPVATGYGGAVATVDLDATKVGLEVLRKGGNAVDAAIAAAATLGVTEPFSAGIGGGGFLVYYSAKDRRVYTVDGREAAPMSMGETAFVDPATGLPYAFQEARVSGIAAGVPGTLATWDKALRKWGTTDLADALRPAAKVADRGFVVDNTFRTQISDNAAAFGQFSSTSALYLPGGLPPEAGTVFRNPDLADTYRQIARHGTGVFYRGAIARDIVDTVQHPPVADVPIGTWAFPIRPGTMALSDLAAYQVRTPQPTRVSYRGYDVYGMPNPSSGGQAVGEALNILEQTDLSALTRTGALHHYLESSALAFADRNRFVGDLTPRPLLEQLLSDGFAKERACLINPAQALAKPVAPGEPDGSYGGCAAAAPSPAVTEGQSTTNLTVADRWGNVVEYTLTIEQTGGNGMVVPGRGFLLNNEMTDFNFTPTQGGAPDPNLPGPGKRPRSSMAPTIVLADGRPFLAVGTPGGSTIITTVLQILVNRLDLGMTLPEAVAAARATQRNTAAVLAEADFAPEIPGLTALGHTFAASPEIGAATGIEFLSHGRMLAAAEPVRRGGGSAGVVWPVPVS